MRTLKFIHEPESNRVSFMFDGQQVFFEWKQAFEGDVWENLTQMGIDIHGEITKIVADELDHQFHLTDNEKDHVKKKVMSLFEDQTAEAAFERAMNIVSNNQ